MITIGEIRKRYPDYQDLSDEQLAKALHSAHYSDMPEAEFYSKIGLNKGRPSNIDAAFNAIPGFGPLIKAFRQPELAAGLAGFNQQTQQYPLGVLQALGIKSADKQMLDYTRAAEEAAKANPNAVGTGRFLGEAVATAPAFASGAGEGALLTQALRGGANAAAGLGALSGLKYVLPGQTRAENATEGAIAGGLIGAGAPLVGAIAGKVAPAIRTLKNRYFNPERAAAEEIFSRIPPEQLNQTFRNAEEARARGLTLSPSEASGSGNAAKFEGGLGTTNEGAINLESARREQALQQKQVVDKFLKSVSPEGIDRPFAEQVRKAAQDVIKKEESELTAKVTPAYERSKHQAVPENIFTKLMDDPNIREARKVVLRDPIYEKELRSLHERSIGALDMVKKQLDRQIDAAKIGNDKEAVRSLMQSKSQLLGEMDRVSPLYRYGRMVYAEESPIIDKIRKGDVGQLSKLNDTQLQTLSNKLFDRGETNHAAFVRIMDKIKSVNPEAWNGITRLHMEKLLRAATEGAQQNAGSNFYNAILRNQTNYEQFITALEGNKEAQETLKSLRRLFKDLENNYSPKANRGKAEHGLEPLRNFPYNMGEYVLKLLGGSYDDAATKLIYSHKWQKIFKDIMFEKGARHAKSQHKLLKLLDILSKSSAHSFTKER